MSSLADTEVLLRVSEHMGNPGSFKFFIQDTCILSIRFNVALEKDIYAGETPVIEGDTFLADEFVKASGFKKAGSSSRVIRIAEDIKFIDKGEPFIILKLVDFRGEGIA